ncbi:MAG: hypothetical protein R3C68_04535 [Myxococcota bacterium]
MLIVIVSNAITIRSRRFPAPGDCHQHSRRRRRRLFYDLAQLGLEVGGAIGIHLFLSQVFSVTLYAFGLAETLRLVWPDIPLGPTALCYYSGGGR